MKTTYLILLFAFLLSFDTFAQVPQGFSYQAVVRDNEGNILANSSAELLFKIYKNSTDGMVVYSETHSEMTNDFGLINVVIGQGSPSQGEFAEIDWTAGDHFLSVTINRTEIGVTQLLSVPYALVAGKTEKKEHIMTIPSVAFIPNNNAAYYANGVGQGGTRLSNPGQGIVNRLVAPLYLPHGAVINEISVSYKDNSTAVMDIRLSIESLSEGVFAGVNYIVTTVGASPEWRTKSKTTNYVIDNINYGYFLVVDCDNWAAEGEKAIKGVTLKYTY